MERAGPPPVLLLVRWLDPPRVAAPVPSDSPVGRSVVSAGRRPSAARAGGGTAWPWRVGWSAGDVLAGPGGSRRRRSIGLEAGVRGAEGELGIWGWEGQMGHWAVRSSRACGPIRIRPDESRPSVSNRAAVTAEGRVLLRLHPSPQVVIQKRSRPSAPARKKKKRNWGSKAQAHTEAAAAARSSSSDTHPLPNHATRLRGGARPRTADPWSPLGFRRDGRGEGGAAVRADAGTGGGAPPGAAQHRRPLQPRRPRHPQARRRRPPRHLLPRLRRRHQLLRR